MPTKRQPKIAASKYVSPASARLSAQVEGLAAKSGWLKVVGSVTGKLAFLCMGDNPGPAKLEKATRQGVTIVDRDQFAKLLSDGELPPAKSKRL